MENLNDSEINKIEKNFYQFLDTTKLESIALPNQRNFNEKSFFDFCERYSQKNKIFFNTLDSWVDICLTKQFFFITNNLEQTIDYLLAIKESLNAQIIRFETFKANILYVNELISDESNDFINVYGINLEKIPNESYSNPLKDILLGKNKDYQKDSYNYYSIIYSLLCFFLFTHKDEIQFILDIYLYTTTEKYKSKSKYYCFLNESEQDEKYLVSKYGNIADKFRSYDLDDFENNIYKISNIIEHKEDEQFRNLYKGNGLLIPNDPISKKIPSVVSAEGLFSLVLHANKDYKYSKKALVLNQKYRIVNPINNDEIFKTNPLHDEEYKEIGSLVIGAIQSYYQDFIKSPKSKECQFTSLDIVEEIGFPKSLEVITRVDKAIDLLNNAKIYFENPSSDYNEPKVLKRVEQGKEKPLATMRFLEVRVNWTWQNSKMVRLYTLSETQDYLRYVLFETKQILPIKKVAIDRIQSNDYHTKALIINLQARVSNLWYEFNRYKEVEKESYTINIDKILNNVEVDEDYRKKDSQKEFISEQEHKRKLKRELSNKKLRVRERIEKYLDSIISNKGRKPTAKYIENVSIFDWGYSKNNPSNIIILFNEKYYEELKDSVVFGHYKKKKKAQSKLEKSDDKLEKSDDKLEKSDDF